MPSNKHIAIIGAGIAGIAASVELIKQGYKVTLIDANSKIGGRLFSQTDSITGEEIDNGQHVMIGAYKHFFNLIMEIGTLELLWVQPRFKIIYLFPNDKQLTLKELGGFNFGKKAFEAFKNDLNSNLVSNSINSFKRFLGQLGLLIGFLEMQGISLKSKLSLLKMLNEVKSSNFRCDGLTCSELLNKYKQNSDILQIFWEPLIYATLNAKPENADASLLINVLREGFFADSISRKMIIPKVGLSQLLEPFKNWFEMHSGDLRTSSYVQKLNKSGDSIQSVMINGQNQIEADVFILALPPESLQRLAFNSSLGEQFNYLKSLSYSPIVSVYLWYDRDIADFEFAAMIGSHTQWLFNKRRNYITATESNPNYPPCCLSLVISAANQVMNMSESDILELCQSEINNYLPNFKSAKLIHSKVIKYARATLLITPQIEAMRPGNDTLFRNMFIAGDWTKTGLPATIEGAVRSGHEAASLAIKYVKSVS